MRALQKPLQIQQLQWQRGNLVYVPSSLMSAMGLDQKALLMRKNTQQWLIYNFCMHLSSLPASSTVLLVQSWYCYHK